jgi:PIN domain nuclease of toxin-antitoxin system
MRVLLDTHAFLWFLDKDPRLPTEVADVIEDDANEKMLSIASIWEMAIKHNLGKLKLSRTLDRFLAIELEGFEVLPITMAHALRVASLPLHHRDPFDRMLVAQSLVDSISIVSKDAMFDAYGVGRFWPR